MVKPHLSRSKLAASALAALCAAVLVARAAEPRPAAPAPSASGRSLSQGEDAALREREGSLLTDVAGYFKATGDRATFFTADGKRRYGGLENMNLERVTNAIANASEQLQWSVSGQVTEYRGANYLLITRAIIKNKPKPAARTPDASSPTAAGPDTAKPLAP